jgi:sigma-B regulation protein RsbU (phosphoserine phosphatase)
MTLKTFNELLGEITLGVIQDYAKERDIVAALAGALPIILKSIGAQAVSLFLVDEQKSILKCELCLGPVNIKGIRVPVSVGLVGKSFTSRKGLLIKDAKLSAEHYSKVDRDSGFETHSILTVPILSGDNAYGCLQAINKIENNTIVSFKEEDLQAFERLALILGIALENLALANSMVKDALIMKDLSAAEDIQNNLFANLERIDQISGVVIPARNLSGDFFDYLQISGKIYFCEGDVSGKGIPAALTVARCSALFRLFAKAELEPSQIAQKINNELFDVGGRFGKSAGFVTFCIGTLDLESGLCQIVNCGHGDLILIDEQKNITTLSSSLPPLGVMTSLELNWDCREIYLTNNKLYIFTDGLLESRPKGDKVEELGLDGVKSLIKYVANLSPAESASKLMSLFKNEALTTNDDATLLVIGI